MIASRTSAAKMILAILFLAPWLQGETIDQVTFELGKRIAAAYGSERPVRLVLRSSPDISEQSLYDLGRLLERQLLSRSVQVSSQPAAHPVTLMVTKGLLGLLVTADLGGLDTPDSIVLPFPESSVSDLAGSAHIVLKRSSLLRQKRPILDLVRDGDTIWVLSPSELVSYQLTQGGWDEVARAALGTACRPARDPRGQLELAGPEVHAYLPGCLCRVSASGDGISCEESQAAWPSRGSVPTPVSMHPSPGRNYFDQLRIPGRMAPALAPFFSAAFLPADTGGVWALAMIDGSTSFLDLNLQPIGQQEGWGRELTTVQPASGCPAVLLAVVAGSGASDSLRAFRMRLSRPYAVSDALGAGGTVTGLRPGWEGTALVVARDPHKGEYEASEVEIVCAP